LAGSLNGILAMRSPWQQDQSLRRGDDPAPKWAVNLFRAGVAACVVWLIVIITQFDVTASVIAIWNHNPSTSEIAAARQASEARAQNCARYIPSMQKQEFPPLCLSDYALPPGIPRDLAMRELQHFALNIIGLVAGGAMMNWLGIMLAKRR
jgi:hypothetical protein